MMLIPKRFLVTSWLDSNDRWRLHEYYSCDEIAKFSFFIVMLMIDPEQVNIPIIFMAHG